MSTSLRARHGKLSPSLALVDEAVLGRHGQLRNILMAFCSQLLVAASVCSLAPPEKKKSRPRTGEAAGGASLARRISERHQPAGSAGEGATGGADAYSATNGGPTGDP